MKADRKHSYRSYVKTFVCMLTITDMATARNYEVRHDKFNVVGTRTYGNYVQKCVIINKD